MNEKYKDILYREHFRSKKHTSMSSIDRAAQFGSFAALTGHSDMIKEEGRLVDDKIILNEEQIFELNDKMKFLIENILSLPECTVTYFVSDCKKQGGVYVTEKLILRKIDIVNRTFITADKREIAVDDILEIAL